MNITVRWENANALDLATIVDMAEDGYEFCVGNGRINEVMFTIPSRS